MAERIESKGISKIENRKYFEKLFQQASPLLKKFVARMVENNDFFRILTVADMLGELMRAHKHELRVVLNVAKLPATPEKLEALKARISLYHLPNDTLPVWEINEKPDLISGYSVSTKEMTVDMSQAGRDKKMTERLAVIMKKIQAAHPEPSLKPEFTPRVIKRGDELQAVAVELKKREEESRKQSEAHFNHLFVDWA